jgi:hypothetical protein
MFAENKVYRSSVTYIQSISTVPSVEKGMPSRVSVFCFLTLNIFNTPFVIDIAITVLSVPRDYIPPYYTKMFDNSTSLIVNTYLE